MVELVSLSMMKQHLRVEGNQDDAYIAFLSLAARRACENHIDKSVVGLTPDLTNEDDRQIVAQAMMLLVEGWYSNRGAVSSGVGSAPTELPLSIRWVLSTIQKQVA